MIDSPAESVSAAKRLAASAVPGFVLVFSWAVGALADAWGALGVPHMAPAPADLLYVTSASGCSKGEATGTVLCDPFGRAWAYPSIWLHAFRFFGITEGSTLAIAAIQMALFVLALALIVFTTTRAGGTARTAALVGAACASPAVLLAVERGNVDVFVFFLTIGALLLIAGGARLAGALGVAAAAALKLHPVGAVLALADGKRKLQTLGWLLLVVVPLLPLLPEWRSISAVQADPGRCLIAFGLIQPLGCAQHTLGLERSSLGLAGLIAPPLFAVVTAALCYMPARCDLGIRELAADIGSDARKRALFLGSAGAYLATYLSSTNFDYKLIWLLPVIAVIASSALPVRLAAYLPIAILLAMHASGTRSAILWVIGDLILLACSVLIAAILALTILTNAAQSAASVRRTDS